MSLKATRETLPETPIDRLVAERTCEERGVARGEVLGYRCRECGQGDETLGQIIHDDGCPLEDYSDYDVPDGWGDSSIVLRPEHGVDMIRANSTDNSVDVRNNEVMLFRCRECGNADEDVFEIVHDERCSLARDSISPLVSETPSRPSVH